MKETRLVLPARSGMVWLVLNYISLNVVSCK